MCKQCTVGNYCGTGAAAELPCPAGSYSNTAGLQAASACTECPTGSACSTGSTVHVPCAPGTFSSSSGVSACAECGYGTFQNVAGETACKVCPSGSYSANILSCEECQPDEYCVAGATVGMRCPTGFTTGGRGASRFEDCGCFDGTYETSSANGSRTCIDCPDASTRCDKADTRLEALPLAPGFWRQSTTAIDIRACFTPAACIGGPNVTTQCASSQRQGSPYCAVCADGYYGGGDGALCQACAGSTF
jgi:hypothetical protein